MPDHTNERSGQDFQQARDLVMKYGWNTTCFQVVNPGIEYWFGEKGESVVGSVSVGGGCAGRGWSSGLFGNNGRKCDGRIRKRFCGTRRECLLLWRRGPARFT